MVLWMQCAWSFIFLGIVGVSDRSIREH
jgi:hypothetical protein